MLAPSTCGSEGATARRTSVGAQEDGSGLGSSSSVSPCPLRFIRLPCALKAGGEGGDGESKSGCAQRERTEPAVDRGDARVSREEVDERRTRRRRSGEDTTRYSNLLAAAQRANIVELSAIHPFIAPSMVRLVRAGR